MRFGGQRAEDVLWTNTSCFPLDCTIECKGPREFLREVPCIKWVIVCNIFMLDLDTPVTTFCLHCSILYCWDSWPSTVSAWDIRQSPSES